MLERVRRRWERWLTPLPTVDAPDFRDYASRLSARYVQLAAAIFAVSALVWWPTDVFVFREDPLARLSFASTRPWVAAISIALFATLRVVPKRPGVIEACFVLGSSAVWFTLGASKAILGDLGGVWFYFCYLIPFGSTFLVVPLASRTVSAALSSAAYPLAYVCFSPHAFEPTTLRAALSFLVFACVVAVGVGHAFYRLIERDFGQQRALERRVAERTERLRELAAHLETSLENERKRIASELHDHTGQLLVAMRLEYRMLGNELPRSDRLAALARLDELLDEAFRTHRNLITDLRPRVLDELGLVEAVRGLVERVGDTSATQIELRVVGDDAGVDGRIALTVYRVLQEILSNLVKHADAMHARVEFDITSEHLRLCACDDGVGFDPARVSSRRFGLFGMRERVESMGGTLEVHSCPGTGTEVRAMLPASVDQAVAKTVGHHVGQ